MEKEKRTYTFLYVLLLFACCIPKMKNFSDEMLMPKWYYSLFVFLTIIIVNCLWHKKSESNHHESVMRASIYKAALIIEFVECAYVVIQIIIGTEVEAFGVIGTFENPAGLALFLCVLLPLGLNGNHRKYYKTLPFIALLLTITVIILSKSRAGLLSLIVSGSIITLNHPYIIQRKWFPELHPLYRKGFILCIITCTLCYSLFIKQESTTGRKFILERTVELIEEQPLTGYGSGGFNKEYMKKQEAYFRRNLCQENMLTNVERDSYLADEVLHPLNEFAFVAVEYGMVGLTFFLIIMFIPLFVLCKKGGAHTANYVEISIITTLIIFSLFSYPFKYPIAWYSLSFIWYNCLTVIVHKNKFLASSHLKLKLKDSLTKMKYFIVSICVILMILLIRELSFEKAWGTTARLALYGKSEKAMPQYKSLYTHYKNNPYFLYNYAAEQYVAGRYSEAQQTAIECSNLWAGYGLELLSGDICKMNNNYDEAIKHYESAMYMCPSRFAPLEGLFHCYEKMNDSINLQRIIEITRNKKMKVISADAIRIKEEITGK